MEKNKFPPLSCNGSLNKKVMSQIDECFSRTRKNEEKKDGGKVAGSKAISSLMIEEINSCLIAKRVSTFRLFMSLLIRIDYRG